MDFAVCREVDGDPWYPPEREGSAGQPYDAARAICAGCPVDRECLEYALHLERSAMYNRHGMWGGHTPQERTAIARRRKRSQEKDTA